MDKALELLTSHYRRVYKQAEQEKEKRIAELTSTPEARQAYFALLDAHRNESLAEFVTNKNDVNVITEEDGELVQKSDPIYLEPRAPGFFQAHFYAPSKRFFGFRVPTFWGNLMVLWGMSMMLMVALRLEVFQVLIERLSAFRRRS
ncbi:MAG: hypothetical protein IPK99_10890 [Flavobacteriales bacterium]|nr:hypothetical protein [Flavobacteriales bacterium]